MTLQGFESQIYTAFKSALVDNSYKNSLRKFFKIFGQFKNNAYLCIAIGKTTPTSKGSRPANASRLLAAHIEICENSSVGRARPCQGRGRGFESRFSLH